MTHYNAYFQAPNPTYPLTYFYEYEKPGCSPSDGFPGFCITDTAYCPANDWPTDCRDGVSDASVKQCKELGLTKERWEYAYVTEVCKCGSKDVCHYRESSLS